MHVTYSACAVFSLQTTNLIQWFQTITTILAATSRIFPLCFGVHGLGIVWPEVERVAWC